MLNLVNSCVGQVGLLINPATGQPVLPQLPCNMAQCDKDFVLINEPDGPACRPTLRDDMLINEPDGPACRPTLRDDMLINEPDGPACRPTLRDDMLINVKFCGVYFVSFCLN